MTATPARRSDEQNAAGDGPVGGDGPNSACCHRQNGPPQAPSPPWDVMVASLGCGDAAAFTDLAAGDVVLALGCVASCDLLRASAEVGSTGRVIAVDDDVLIPRVDPDLAAAGLGAVEVRKGGLHDIPVADASVDCVISHWVINLARGRPRVFAEIARVLKPGGRIRAAEVVVELLPDWVRQAEGLRRCRLVGALCEDDYVAGLRDAGLSEISVRGRYVYDRGQVAGITLVEPASSVDACRLADALVGRVWSVHVSATKPRAR